MVRSQRVETYPGGWGACPKAFRRAGSPPQTVRFSDRLFDRFRIAPSKAAIKVQIAKHRNLTVPATKMGLALDRRCLIISSANYVRYDLNTNTRDKTGWPKVAVNRLCRDGNHFSAIAQRQLGKLVENNKLIVGQIRRLNDRLVQLPGLSEQAPRPDMERVYYAVNTLFVDETKAGMSREACVKALRAEGVAISPSVYTVQHKLQLYKEPEWWHHKPTIPETLSGCELANRTAMPIRCFTKPVPELIDQYIKAFEKVWPTVGN